MPGEAASAGLRGCVFCGIADGRESALFFHNGEHTGEPADRRGAVSRMFVDSRRGEPSVAWSAATPDVYVFENQFLFYDLTSLVIPGWHSAEGGKRFYGQQSALWRDLGAAGRTARDHGLRSLELMQERNAERAPQGFRVFCNFGAWGEQTQPHAHLQVHAGRELDPSRLAPTSEPWPEAARRFGGPIAETESTLFYDAAPVLEAGRSEIWKVTLSMGFSAARRELPPFARLAVPRSGASQWALWNEMGAMGAEIVSLAEQETPQGFRLMANFPGQERENAWGEGHVLIVGGHHIGLYADYF